MNYKVIKQRKRLLNPVTNNPTVLKTPSNSWINILAAKCALASFNICVIQAGQTEED